MQCSNGDNFRGQTFHRRQGSDLPSTWSREEVLAETDLIEKLLAGYKFSNRTQLDVSGKDAAACVISENIESWPSWFLSELPPADWDRRLPDTPEWVEAKAAVKD